MDDFVIELKELLKDNNGVGIIVIPKNNFERVLV